VAILLAADTFVIAKPDLVKTNLFR
jgi:hypothetical protein